jgi:hypothetical protein
MSWLLAFGFGRGLLPRDTENPAIREARECITTAFREVDFDHP